MRKTPVVGTRPTTTSSVPGNPGFARSIRPVNREDRWPEPTERLLQLY